MDRGRRRTNFVDAVVALAVCAPLWAVDVALAADCNQNGVDDLEEVALGMAQDCNGNGIPDDCDLQPLSTEFESRTVGEPLVAPVFSAIADLDGDAILDVAVIDEEGLGGRIHMFLSGPGRDHSVHKQKAIAASGSLAAGDLDGDGDNDLAIPDAIGDSILVLRNDGTGGFPEPAISISLDFRPEGMAIADLDGDGDRDLAIAGRVLLNDRNLGFSSAVDLPLPGGGSPPRREVLAFDADGDGDNDLVVTNADGRDARSAMNRASTATAMAASTTAT